MEPADIRRYQVHLLEGRQMGVGTVINHVAALRFLRKDTEAARDEAGSAVPETRTAAAGCVER